MPIKHTNFASSKLAVGLGAGDVTLAVTGTHGSRFPVLGAGDFCYLVLENAVKQREIVKATARTGDTFTVVRGQDDTTAQAWVAGDTVSLRFVKAAIADSIGNAVQRTSATGAAIMPAGTTAERDGTPFAGYLRYNTTTTSFEGYNGASWAAVGGGNVQQTTATGSVIMPAGTTAQRDGTPSVGYLRYNTTTAAFEGYNGASWAAIGGGSSGMEGEVCYFARNTAPTGFLKANGALVSRTTYAALFAAIGTTFGAGDGSTTFALPDLRGEFLRGWDDGRGVDGGRPFASFQSANVGAHSHTIPELSASGGLFNSTTAGGGAITYAGRLTQGDPTGETRPRNIALLACIRF